MNLKALHISHHALRITHYALRIIIAAAPLTASAQHLTASQQVIDLGNILYRQPTTVNFTLQNDSREQVYIDKVKTSCGCATVDYPKKGIKKGEKITLAATYDAKQLGHFEKLVGVYVRGVKDPVLLRMKGVVVSGESNFTGEYVCAVGDLKTDKDYIEFDDVNRGDKPMQELRIFNSTSETVEPVLMHLPDYLTATITPKKIAPGRSGVARIILDSQKMKDFGLVQTSIYLGSFPGDKVSEEKELPVSTVLLPEYQNLTNEERLQAPVMQIYPQKLKLGAFNGKKQKKGVVIIRNVGKSTLDIRSLQLFTPGLKVSLDNRTIPAGGAAKIKVTAFRDELKKAKGKPRFLMITNDPEFQKVTIQVEVDE